MAEKGLPPRFDNEAELEEVMTRPDAALVDDLARLDGDIAILGVGGKMGPTLARLAKRAAPGKRIIGVARFSEPGLEQALSSHGVECMKADLLDRAQVQRLPEVANVVYMAGRKFGSQGAEDLTWAMNVYAPALVAERYAKARIAFFSTGCVYPFVDIRHGGATEAAPLHPPPGDYAASCVGRERLFEYGARAFGTRIVALRLNYAIDTRYGVLHDVATKVMKGQPVDVTSGHVNVIWQGDANAWALRALRLAANPGDAINITGPETVSVRWLAEAFAARFGRKAIIVGQEADTGWLNNAARAFRLFGYPSVALETLVDWVADWMASGKASLGKETHFDTRDGVF